MSRWKNFRQSNWLIELSTFFRLVEIRYKGQFPVSGIFRAGGILDNKKLLSRNYPFNFRATFSLSNKRISARSENSTDWKSALRVKKKLRNFLRKAYPMLTFALFLNQLSTLDFFHFKDHVPALICSSNDSIHSKEKRKCNETSESFVRCPRRCGLCGHSLVSFTILLNCLNIMYHNNATSQCRPPMTSVRPLSI